MKALIALAMLVGTTPALAAVSDDQNASNQQSQPNQPRQICRRVPALSGSHVSRVRICRTAAEWRAASDSSTDDTMDTLATLGSHDPQPTDGYTSERGGPGQMPSPH